MTGAPGTMWLALLLYSLAKELLSHALEGHSTPALPLEYRVVYQVPASFGRDRYAQAVEVALQRVTNHEASCTPAIIIIQCSHTFMDSPAIRTAHLLHTQTMLAFTWHEDVVLVAHFIFRGFVYSEG